MRDGRAQHVLDQLDGLNHVVVVGLGSLLDHAHLKVVDAVGDCVLSSPFGLSGGVRERASTISLLMD